MTKIFWDRRVNEEKWRHKAFIYSCVYCWMKCAFIITLQVCWNYAWASQLVCFLITTSGFTLFGERKTTAIAARLITEITRKRCFNRANVISGGKGRAESHFYECVSSGRQRGASREADLLDFTWKVKTQCFIKILKAHYHPKMRVILQYDETREHSLSFFSPRSEGMLTRKSKYACVS